MSPAESDVSIRAGSAARPPDARGFAASFLRTPDLFPARQAGEPWGDRQIEVDCAGGRYRFAGLNEAQERLAAEQLGGAPPLRDPEGDDVVIRVFRASRDDFARPPRSDSPWEYSLDLAYDENAVRVAAFDFMARLDWRPGLEAALWAPHDTSAFASALKNAFRVLVAYGACHRGGALLHCSAVVSDGEATLFLGASGAGKSTVAGLSLGTGRQVLSDDLNAVLPDGATLRVAAVPFAGSLEMPYRPGTFYPLRGFYSLRQGDRHQVEESSAGLALSTLLSCSPYVNADPIRGERLLSNLESLLRRVPLRRLTFRRDAGFWNLLEA